MGQVTRTNFGLTARKVINHSQIIALPSLYPGGIELVPAPGLSEMIVPMMATLEMIPGAVPANYTNIASNAFLGVNADGNEDEDVLAGASDLNPFQGVRATLNNGHALAILTPSQEYKDDDTGLARQTALHTPIIFNNSPVVGKSLILGIWNDMSGNLTGGAADDVLIVTVFYNIIRLGV